jgi:serine/threonine-protein kinase
MGASTSPPDSAQDQLLKVLGSEVFRNAGRSSKLLRFLVEQALNGQEDRLKEYTIGAEVLGRGESFDPRIDSIARVEVSRLRSRLEQYYASEGRNDPLVIVLPKGSYVPVFEPRRDSPAPRPTDQAMLWFALGGTVVACVFVVGLWALRSAAPMTDRPLVQLEVELRSVGQLGSVVGTHVALSPDGTRLAFVASDSDGVSHIYTRRFAEPAVSELPGSDGARGPFFSPDGQWVAFWASGKVMKAPIAGGSPIIVCEAADLLGGSWGDDGNILAVLNSSSKLWRIPSSGGTPTAAVEVAPGINRQAWPQVLPGAKAVLFTSMGAGGPDAGNIEVFSFREGRRKTVVRGGTYGRYLPSGHVAYINQGTLYALPFDLNRLEPLGAAVAILDNVEYSSTFGFAQFDFARNGTFVYRRTAARGLFTLQWLSSRGETEAILEKPGPYLWPRLSPDGERLAVCRSDSDRTGIWILDLRRRKFTPLSPDHGTQCAPVWSPDGHYIFFQYNAKLVWLPADGSGQPQTILGDNSLNVPWSFSPDGKRLAYYSLSPITHFDLLTVLLEVHGGDIRAGKPEPFLASKAIETYPTFSPDGHWVSYASIQSGSFEVYVRAFPDDGSEVQVSKGGGRVSYWRVHGGELLYSTDDQRIMAATYRINDGVFRAEAPRLWSQTRLADTGVLPNFDVAADGRIAALLPAAAPNERQSPNHVTFLMNFFDELRRRAPAIK